MYRRSRMPRAPSLSSFSSLSSVSTQSSSTSTTSITAFPREEIPFGAFAILNGIHSTLITKSYPQKPDVDASVLESFGRRIVERIQREMTAIILETGLGPETDWERRVFRPVIATFDIEEDIGLCQGDSEYIFLLVAVLSLAFELLLLAEKDIRCKTRAFLARAFNELFVEPEICRIVGIVLDTERNRLARMNAETKITRAIRYMRILLPDVTLCTTAWDASMLRNLQTSDIAHYLGQRMRICDPLESEPRVSRWSEEAATEFFQEARTFAPVRHASETTPHVQVKIFLKYGRSLPFHFITCIDRYQDRARLHMSKGLSMELEACPSVCPIIRVRNRVLVTWPEGSNDGFIGTLSIPPGCAYRAARVGNVGWERRDTDWTVIETMNAVFKMSGNNYRLKFVNVDSSVVVENICR